MRRVHAGRRVEVSKKGFALIQTCRASFDASKREWFRPFDTRQLHELLSAVSALQTALSGDMAPSARCSPLTVGEDTLLVVGVPVYMVRVPALLSNWFQTLTLHRTPTVCVVVYGNRAYENALLELRDLVTAQGGVPLAAAAFIGEHSFSSTDLPASAARPNAGDLQTAQVAFSPRVHD